MKDHAIRFAFAVNEDNCFVPKHFGEADKYLIYEFADGAFRLLKEQNNLFKTMDEEAVHGLKKKGNSIINLLKGEGVKILVSQQFGQNIKMVNSHFIPVIIRDQTLNEVFPILSAKIEWLLEELELKPAEYRLFTVTKGILKCVVK